jgi:hypothetical protein
MYSGSRQYFHLDEDSSPKDGLRMAAVWLVGKAFHQARIEEMPAGFPKESVFAVCLHDSCRLIYPLVERQAFPVLGG